MTFRAELRRVRVLVVAVLAAAAILFGAPAGGAGLGLAPEVPDPEGGTLTLRQQLDAAAAGYIEAKARYDASKALEAQLQVGLKQAELQLLLLNDQVGIVAAASYRSGRLGTVSALLESGSPEVFLQRFTQVEMLAMHENSQLNQLRSAQRQYAQQRDRLNLELHVQAEQLALMEKKKKDAERALAAVGGGRVTGGFVSGNSPAARPAPRNPDGTWPRESCTVDDPTTTGCLTPRTYHAYQQTRAAGFTRYVSCFRSGGGGEHPKGRACDWAAAAGGFGGAATGGDKTYGDHLAMWYVANANRLGVMYVIWYRQIWLNGTGWRSYSGCCDPASAHTNHVHLSIY